MAALPEASYPPEPLDAAEPAIVFEDVSLSFERPVLRHLSFTLRRGETKVLFGEAGSGKTMILKLALGLLKPDQGRITTLGEEVTALAERELFELRRRLGMVFQESALFDSLDIEHNVAFHLMEEGMKLEEARARVVEALRFVELEHTLRLLPSELSGGMRRRAAIARAIISRPELLLYDSPTGGLDPVTSTHIIELLIKQRDISQSSALVVTHRLQDGFVMATHGYNARQGRMELLEDPSFENSHTSFLILREGELYFEGTGEELAQSKDAYLREYLS